jgi:hypothetical protein
MIPYDYNRHRNSKLCWHFYVRWHHEQKRKTPVGKVFNGTLAMACHELNKRLGIRRPAEVEMNYKPRD